MLKKHFLTVIVLPGLLKFIVLPGMFKFWGVCADPAYTDED